MVTREREREREREKESRIDRESLEYDIFRALLLGPTSTRLAQSWLKTFNHLRSSFVQRSYSLSTLASLVQVDFSTRDRLAQRAWLLTAHCLLLTLRTADWLSDWTFGVENFRRYIFFGRLRILPTKFTWHFRCLLFTLTQLHILFWNP